MKKVDVDLEPATDATSAELEIKAGHEVFISAQSDRIEITVSSGSVLGRVPEAAAEQIKEGEYVAHIRSLRRSPGDGRITSINVRFTSVEDGRRRNIVNTHAEDPDDDAEIRRLSKEGMVNLANDEALRNYLRDERLQRVVAKVDSAPNREAALAAALKSPNFKEFADHLLGIVAPEAPP